MFEILAFLIKIICSILCLIQALKIINLYQQLEDNQKGKNLKSILQYLKADKQETKRFLKALGIFLLLVIIAIILPIKSIESKLEDKFLISPLKQYTQDVFGKKDKTNENHNLQSDK